MAKFNETVARTPDEMELQALVARRGRMIGYGIIATCSAVFTAGSGLGAICALTAAGFFFAAYLTKTKVQKKGEVSLFQ